MREANKYLSLTGWIIAIPSVLSLVMAAALLVSSWVTFEWQLSMFEAMGGAIALLSLLGFFCGLGVLRRKKVAWLPSIIWLGVGAAFWVLSTLSMLLDSIDSPSMLLFQIRETPFISGTTILLNVAMSAWFIHTIYMFCRVEVKNAFDA
jgi:hypothetical protein